jgi:hypothetical protein
MDGNADRDSKRDAQQQQLARQSSMVALLEHLLDQYWAMTNQMQHGARPQLLPGEIPEQLPIELPVPEGSRIVGSVLWTQQTTIIFDCDKTREEVLQFCDERLLSQGWTKPEMPDPLGGRGGFGRSLPDFFAASPYCLGESGPSLSVRAISSSERTTVHVTLNTDPEQSPCSPRLRRQYRHMERGLPAVLPDMRPPTGSIQLGGGSSGGGPDNVSSEAWLKSDLDLPGILAHYVEQLVKAGWTEASSGRSGPIGWSTWDFTFEGEQWHGMLTITERPWSKGEYRLRLYAEAEGFGKHGGVVFAGHF